MRKISLDARRIKLLFGFVLSLLILMPLSALAGTPQPSFGAFLCDYYAQAFSHAGSLEGSLAVIPMTDARRDEFAAFLKTHHDPQKSSSASTSTFKCSGETLAITDKGKVIENINFSQIENQKILVNDHEIELSPNRALSDYFSAVSEAVRPSKPAKGVSILWSLFTQKSLAQASRLINGNSTLGWNTSVNFFHGNAVETTLLTVSASDISYSCHTKTPLFHLSMQVGGHTLALHSPNCFSLPSGRMFAYMSGFKSFGFACRNHVVQSLHFSLADYRVGLSDKAANLTFTYVNGAIAAVEKVGSIIPGKCEYRVVNDTVTDVMGSVTCASKNEDDEFKQSVVHGPDLDTGYDSVYNDYLSKRVFAGNTRQAADSNHPDQKHKIRVSNISPIANLSLVQACCADDQCQKDITELAHINGRALQTTTKTAQ